MSPSWHTVIRTIAVAVAAASVCVCAGIRYARDTDPVTVIETRTDTLYLRDTIRITAPVYVTVRTVDTVRVPVPVPGKTDTVWAQLPRDEKVYQDSTYRAVVSGVDPSLDYIEVYRKTVTISTTQRIEPSRWSWGVQTGVGYGSGGVTPYAGIGIQYRLGYFEIRK